MVPSSQDWAPCLWDMAQGMAPRVKFPHSVPGYILENNLYLSGWFTIKKSLRRYSCFVAHLLHTQAAISPQHSLKS